MPTTSNLKFNSTYFKENIEKENFLSEEQDRQTDETINTIWNRIFETKNNENVFNELTKLKG